MKISVLCPIAALAVAIAATSCSGGGQSPNAYVDDYRNSKIVPLQVKESYLYGFVDHKGETVIEPRFGFASSFHDGLALVTDTATKLYGFIGTDGEWVIKPAYASATNFNCGMAMVALPDSGITAIDTKGNVKFSMPQAVNTTYFVSGYSLFDDADGNSGLVDKNGQTIIVGNKLNRIVILENGYVEYIDSDDNRHLAKINGLELEPVQFPEGLKLAGFSTRHKQAIVIVDDKYGLVGFDGKMVVNPRYKALVFDGDDLIAFINDKDKIGWLNTKGEEVIPAKYKSLMFSFDEGNGYAGVSTSGTKYQIINVKGETCVPSKYERMAATWTPGMFFVCKDDRWGIVDKEGNVVCDPQFEGISDAANGMFMASSGEYKWGVIASNGTYQGPLIYTAPEITGRNITVCVSRRFSAAMVLSQIDKMFDGLDLNYNFGKLADMYNLKAYNLSDDWAVTLSSLNRPEIGVNYKLNVHLSAPALVPQSYYSSKKKINSEAQPFIYEINITFDSPEKAIAVFNKLKEREGWAAAEYDPETIAKMKDLSITKTPVGYQILCNEAEDFD